MSKKIGVKQSDPCARLSSGDKMEVNEGKLSEVEGVVKSSEPEPGINMTVHTALFRGRTTDFYLVSSWIRSCNLVQCSNN